jgi:hypothetical protein
MERNGKFRLEEIPEGFRVFQGDQFVANVQTKEPYYEDIPVKNDSGKLVVSHNVTHWRLKEGGRDDYLVHLHHPAFTIGEMTEIFALLD